jgi:putative phosphoribosyl transferase
VVTLGLGETDVEEVKAAVAREVARRAREYPGRRLVDYLPAPTVVIVDDGLATGLTMQAAIGYVQRHGAEAVVVAVPCASERAAFEVRSLLQRPGDRFVCPIVDPEFGAVGEHYRDFRQVTDDEVTRVLGRVLPPAQGAATRAKSAWR